MLSSLLTLLVINMILMIMLMIINFTSKKTFHDKEKNSPFECGFDPKNNARLPFSIQFFLIAIIFLIFDVEIVLLMPIMKIFDMSNLINMSITFNLFIIILTGGLYHEWNQGALNWLK